MIKLFKVKEKQKELAETAAGEPPVKKQTAGHLRLIRVLQWHEMEDSKLKPSEDSPLLSCSRLADSVDSCYSLSLSYFPHIKDLMPQYPPFDSLSEACVKLYFDLAGDISELNLPKRCTIKFPNGQDDVMHFEVTICPDEGYYENGAFVFSFQASPLYPHEPPKVKCKTKVYHPNIDLEGNVCLNILREDWKPVLNVNTIIYGLYHLFTEPNHEDPLYLQSFCFNFKAAGTGKQIAGHILL